MTSSQHIHDSLGDSYHEDFLQHRVFKVKGDIEYQAPVIDALFSKSNIPDIHYIDGDGNAYDIHYNLIPSDHSKIGSIIQVSKEKPTPEQFERYFEYEQALVEWRLRVEKELKGISLPVPLGRYFYRPNFSSIIKNYLSKKKSKRNDFSDFDDSFDSSLTMTDSYTSASSPKSDSPTEDSFMLSTIDTSEISVPRRKHSAVSALGIHLRKLSESDQSSSHESVNSAKQEAWGSVLIPLEPDPNDFDTYDDFEGAYQRWASITSKIQFLPPHTTQLRKIIPIIPPIIYEAPEIEEVVQITERPRRCCYGLIRFPFLETRSNQEIVRISHQPRDYGNLPDKKSNEISINNEVLKGVLDLLDTLNTKSQRFKSFQSTQKPLTPKAIMNEETTRLYYRSTTNYRNDVLTHPDTVISSEKVPFYDIVNLSYRRMFIDKSYNFMLKKKLSQLQTLYSKNIPAIVPMEASDEGELNDEEVKSIEQISVLMDNFIEMKNVSYESICPILFVSASDSFFKTAINQKSNHLINVFTGKNIGELLQFFKLSDSPCIHMRVSYIVTQLLQEVNFSCIMDSLLESHNLTDISRIIYAVILSKQTPLDVFPYDKVHVDMAIRVLGDKYAAIVHSFLEYYYISILNEQCIKNEYYSINVPYVKDKKEKIRSSLCSMFQDQSKDLIYDIFKGLKHRSKHIAYTTLFIWVQMFTGNNSLKNAISSNREAFFDQLRLIACSKLSHVKLVARKVYEKLKSPEWFQCMLDCRPIILEDIMSSTISNEYFEFLMDLVMISIEDASIRTDDTHVKWLLNNDIYHKLIRLMNTDETPFIVNRARLLRCVVRGCYKLGMLKQTRQGTASIIISQQNIEDLQGFLTTIPTSKVNLDSLRYLILSSLRYLLISNQAFEFLKRDETIHIHIAKNCKSQHEKTCKEAWKFIYQMIKYHPNIGDALVKKKYITHYFDHLSVSGGNHTMRYSLHYLAKLFSLPPVDSKKNAQGKWKMNADLKTLSSFIIQSHLFIKIHMMYKKLIEGKSGAAFYELLNFYNLIIESPNCKKLYKEVSKSEDFREGIRRVCSLSQSMPLDAKISKRDPRMLIGRRKGTF